MLCPGHGKWLMPSAAPTALPRPGPCLDEDNHCENSHSCPLTKHGHIAGFWKQKVYVTNNTNTGGSDDNGVSLGGAGSPGRQLPPSRGQRAGS